MPELNPEHVKSVISAINQSPFFKHLSMKVIALGPGRATVTLRIGKKHMNPFGGLHGGSYSAAIDTAAYWSAYCELPEEHGLVTIDLKVDFLAPLTGGQAVVEGRTIKSGKSICLAEASMLDGQGRMVAHGTSKLMVTRQKQSINKVVEYLGTRPLPAKFLRG